KQPLSGSVAQALRQPDRFAKMLTRLDIGRAVKCALADASPGSYGCLILARRSQMISEQLRLRLGDLLELVAQGPCHRTVQLVPPASQQALIGGILHQRMLESVRGIRGHALSMNKVRLGKPFERFGKHGL